MSSHDFTAAATPPPVRPKSQRRFLLVNKRPSSSSSTSSSPSSSRIRDSSTPPSRPRPPPRPAPLSIRATVKFKAPLDHSYENTYETSPFFDPTDHFCHSLLRRLDHGCTELVTRRDSTALDNRSGEKTLRFEMTFTIRRAGNLWSIRSYRSYQRLFLDKHSASDVAEATDTIIGSFLRRHDRNFKWHALDPPSFEPDPAMLSVPLARFVVSKQDYEHVPGYEIVFTFSSRCKARGAEPLWERRIAVESRQTTPLTLTLAEELSWNLSQAVHHTLDRRKQTLDEHHRSSCDPTLDGDGCGHLDERSLNVAFRIQNHLGVDISHLHRSITTRLALFRHPEGLDCQEFTDDLEKCIVRLRDHADDTLGRHDDLRIAVRRLSGTGWEIENPFSLSVDSSVCYSRRTIQAVLDRVQSGIGDVFRGKSVAVTLKAVKRGHKVLDKTLVARSFRKQTMVDPLSEEETILSMLKDRMQSDVAMVIRDTGSLVDVGESLPPNLRLIDQYSPFLPEVLPEPPEAVSVVGSQDEDEDALAATTRASELDGNPLSAPEPPAQAPEPTTGRQVVKELDAAGPEHRLEGPGWITPDARRAKLPTTPPRRLSHAAVSFSTTDSDGEPVAPSTRPSTPSLCGNELETPMDSIILAPTTPHAVLDHFAVRKSFDDHCMRAESFGDELIPTIESIKRPKEPRRFSLLGRYSRPSTPASTTILPETNAAPEPVTGHGREEAASPDATPLEGWLEFSCEPLDCEDPPSDALASRDAGARDSGVVVDEESTPPAALECKEICVEPSKGGCITADDAGNARLNPARSEAMESEAPNVEEVRPGTTQPTPEKNKSEQVELKEVESTQLEADQVEPEKIKVETVGADAAQGETFQDKDTALLEIVQEEAARDKMIGEETVQDETVQEEVQAATVQDQTVEEETAQEQTTQGEIVQDGAVQEAAQEETTLEEPAVLGTVLPESVQEETIQEEPAVLGTVLPESVQEEAAQDQAVRDENVQAEAVQEVVVQDETVQDESVQDETVQEGIVLPETVQDEATLPETLQEEVAQDKIVQGGTVQEEGVQEETALPETAKMEEIRLVTVEPEMGKTETAEVGAAEPEELKSETLPTDTAEEVWPGTVELRKVETDKAETETAGPETDDPEPVKGEAVEPEKVETENIEAETVGPVSIEADTGVEMAGVEKAEADVIDPETAESHPIEPEEAEPGEELPECADSAEANGALQSWRAMAPFDDPPAGETPEPNTPAMTIGSESSDTSPTQSLTPAQLGSQPPTRIVGTVSAMSLTPRSQLCSPFMSGDGDLDMFLHDSPSRRGRKRVDSHGSPFTLSIPTYLPPKPLPSQAALELPLPIRRRRDRPRDSPVPHRRQFSVPTAGFVGLLHHPDSPLRLHKHCTYRPWDHLRHQRQSSLPADADGGAGEANAEGDGRRLDQASPARLLLGYGQEKLGLRSSPSPDVVRPSRPRVMSAQGIITDARQRARSGSGSSSGVRSRSGSMLGTAIWST